MSAKRLLIKYVKKIIKLRKKLKRKKSIKINEERLVSDLEKFGLKSGMSIFVHSSLSNLGFIEEGPQTVINALQKIISPQGTISMPGFTVASNSFAKSLEYWEKSNKPFDYKMEEPLIGSIPRCFFYNENVFRSIHPTHSVLAWGKEAKYITDRHEECNNTFGKGTPLYKLIETGSYIMGLGSDLGHVTFYHVLEDTLIYFPVKVYDNKLCTIKIVLTNGNIEEKKYQAHCSHDFRIERVNSRWLLSYYRNFFIKYGGLKEGKIGESISWIIKAEDMFNCLHELLTKGYTIYTKPKNKIMRMVGYLLKQ